MDALSVIKNRRTIRFFKQQVVSNEEITSLINFARMASSAANAQRLRYIAITSPKLVEEIFNLTAYAGHVKPKRSPIWGKNAPLTFIAITGPADAGPTLYADCGAAIENLQLAAWEMGIGCCWIGSFDKSVAETLLKTPLGSQILYLVAIGYPDECPTSCDIDEKEDTKYYLTEDDTLVVPKIKVEGLLKWL